MSTNSTEAMTNFQIITNSPCRTTLLNPSIFCTLSYLIYIVLRYVILGVVGTLGNILNIVILFRKRMRTASTSVLLISLAVSDLLFIHVTLQLEKLQVVSDVFCKLGWFLVMFSGQFSAWTLVLVSIERMVFLKYPVFARNKITWQRALVSSVITLGVLSMFNGHLLFGPQLKISTSSTNITLDDTDTEKRFCGSSSNGYTHFLKTIWPSMYLLSYCMLPIIVISVNTTIVINGLRRQGRQVTSTQQNTNGMSERDKRNASVSRTMMFVCVYFAITMSLFGAFFIALERIPTLTNDEHLPVYVFVYAVLSTLNYSNSSLNCIFYFVCGTQFKREWREIIQSLRSKFRQTIARGNTNESRPGNSQQSQSTKTTRVTPAVLNATARLPE